jgi:hypothetical protein
MQQDECPLVVQGKGNFTDGGLDTGACDVSPKDGVGLWFTLPFFFLMYEMHI